MSETKKDFMPAPPPGWKLDPRYVECKTRRTQLLLAPSLHARIKAAAEADGQSFNAWCSGILEAAVQESEREREIEESLSGAAEGDGAPAASEGAGETPAEVAAPSGEATGGPSI